MKSLILALLFLSVPAFAEEEERWELVPSENPYTVTWKVHNAGGQASMYTGTEKLFEAWNTVSEAELVKKEVVAAYALNECGPDGKYLDPELKDLYCGSLDGVYEQNTVRWAYGRGGWAEAGAGYRSFLTFETAGTGHFTQMALAIESAVDVAHLYDESTESDTIFEVKVSFQKIHVYDLDGNVSRVVELK